jgi:2-methylcitrate dehydratase PrpD
VTVAEYLGEFVAATSVESIPDGALELASMLVASTVASAAAGRDIASTQIMRDLAIERGGRADASIWFSAGPRLPLAETAQVNAVSSDAAASDDTDLRNVLHAGTPATVSALALAERDGLDGESVLVAIVLAYQVAGRIAAAMTPGFRDRGFHASIGAVFAAAVATSRLLRLSPTAVAHAIVLSATSIGGLIAAADTSTSREYHAGLATLLGINAAVAASRGYEGELSILETPRGYFEAFGGTDGERSGVSTIARLEDSWDITNDLAIKLAPGGHTFHAIAEAAAIAVARLRIAPEDVSRIVISRPGVVALSGELHPHDLVSMAHSPAFYAAAGVVDGSLSWSHASPAKISDPAIHRMIDKVEVGPEPPATEALLFRMGATVTITTVDGSTETSTVYAPRGAAVRGIAWDDLDSKFRALGPSGGLEPGDIEATLEMIHGFRFLPNVRLFVTALCPGST